MRVCVRVCVCVCVCGGGGYMFKLYSVSRGLSSSRFNYAVFYWHLHWHMLSSLNDL